MNALLKPSTDHWDFDAIRERLGAGAPLPRTGTATGAAPAAAVAGEPEAPALTRLSAPEDWDRLIARVQSAARHSREVEAQAQEQELRVQQLLEQIGHDICEADARVRAAEARGRELQAQLTIAEQRAQAAEERARMAETWLMRLQETILAEFGELPRQDVA